MGGVAHGLRVIGRHDPVGKVVAILGRRRSRLHDDTDVRSLRVRERRAGKELRLCGASALAPAPGSSDIPTLELTRTSGPSSGAAQMSPDALLGRVYGERYRVDAFLGAGGMGRVYRVHDLVDQADRALKVIRPDQQGDPGRGDRFRREVGILSRLSHPAVPRVVGFGEAGGELFFVSEVVNGLDVKRLLAAAQGVDADRGGGPGGHRGRGIGRRSRSRHRPS